MVRLRGQAANTAPGRATRRLTSAAHPLNGRDPLPVRPLGIPADHPHRLPSSQDHGVGVAYTSRVEEALCPGRTQVVESKIYNSCAPLGVTKSSMRKLRHGMMFRDR